MTIITRGKHIYPEAMALEAEEALAQYPGLADVHIHFYFSKISVLSYMLAQPVFHTLLYPRKKRKYRIMIRERLVIGNPNFSQEFSRRDVIVGWLGHELGHILDYEQRNSWNLIWFGLRYHFYPDFVKKAEITADRNAVKAGLAHQIIKSKQFARQPGVFSEHYVEKLNELYPSVEDVRKWIKEL